MAIDNQKSVFKLELHEQTFIEGTGIRVTRVPGGWVYTQIVNRGNAGSANATAGSANATASITSTFVPFHEEGSESKYNDENEEVHI